MNAIMNDAFTVRSLFEVPDLKEAVLLGGSNGLNSIITRVNVVEAPNIIDWVHPGELLMTSSYSFQNRPEQIATLVEQLASRGIAALGVKFNKSLDQIPSLVIDAANRCGLPLIELPPSATFSELVREIMERVFISESKNLMILQTRIQRLTQLLLKDDGIETFVQHLNIMLQNPVLLLTPNQEKVAPQEVLEWCEQIKQEEWDQWLSEKSNQSRSIMIGNEKCLTHSITVTGHMNASYRLLVIEQHSQYSTLDELTANWASRLLGFEISNMQVKNNIQAKYFDQFLKDWITGRIVSPIDLQQRATACGWNLEKHSYMVGSVFIAKDELYDQHLQRMLHCLEEEADTVEALQVKWTLLEGKLTLLFALDGLDWNEEQHRIAISQFWNAMKKKNADMKAVLCLSRVIQNPQQIVKGYRESERVEQIWHAYRKDEDLLYYNQLGVYLLLFQLQGTDEMEEFKQLYLNPLLKLDQKQHGDLLNTLITYFDCNCNAKETADRMYVHYNTINYRLDRIRQELQLKLDDPEVKLQLQLAIKAYYMNK